MEEDEVAFSIDLRDLQNMPPLLRREAVMRLAESIPKDLIEKTVRSLIARGCVFCGKSASADTITRDENGELATNWFPLRNQETGEHGMCCAECRLWLGPKRQ